MTVSFCSVALLSIGAEEEPLGLVLSFFPLCDLVENLFDTDSANAFQYI